VHGDVYGETREDVERAEIDVSPIPPVDVPGLEERAAAADAEARERREGMGVSGSGRDQIPRRRLDLPEVDAPPAERKGKPNPLQRTPQKRHPMQRRPYLEADPYEEATTPPPPPDLEDVPVETTPPKKADTSAGRARKMDVESAPPDNPLIKESYRMLGKMEQADKAALMKYFDEANIKYFGGSVDPTVVAWCAVYLNAVLTKAGYVPLDTESYAAREYMNYGTEGTGRVGDIAVWDNHVGIVVEGGNIIKILGGNQKDGVTIADKVDIDKKTNFLGYRKPMATRTSRRNSRTSRGNSRFADMR
jgi:hypothetical protein